MKQSNVEPCKFKSNAFVFIDKTKMSIVNVAQNLMISQFISMSYKFLVQYVHIWTHMDSSHTHTHQMPTTYVKILERLSIQQKHKKIGIGLCLCVSDIITFIAQDIFIFSHRSRVELFKSASDTCRSERVCITQQLSV